MSELIERLKQLSSAEEFLDFFGIRYQEAVVHVNRLHILKRFYQYLRNAQDLDSLVEVDLFKRYRDLLARAYQDFVDSTPAREKVFKVFQDIEGKQVPLSALRADLAQRRAEPVTTPGTSPLGPF